jgi:hypothetical protein
MGKKEDLAELISKRREDRNPKYHSLSEFDGGFYDGEWVVPWTISAYNLDALLMIVAQDWISEEYANKNNKPQQRKARKDTGQDAVLPTNKNLKEFLERAFKLEFSQTYATDVSIFIKPGDMDGDVPMEDLECCAKEYTLPQIKIVRPRMVLCLGAKTFNSVRRALGQPEMKLSEARLPTSHTVCAGSEIYGVPHTGDKGTWNAGGKDKVHKIWETLAARFIDLTALGGRHFR